MMDWTGWNDFMLLVALFVFSFASGYAFGIINEIRHREEE